MNKIISIIPARSGSKSIPGKNIVEIEGYPLIAYSIIASQQSNLIERTIVSTDSEKIAKIAKQYGAEVPFLRPVKIASDESPDIDWVFQALQWFMIVEKHRPDYIVHLRPTTPLRSTTRIDEAIHLMIKDKEATSLRSAELMSESPYKCFMKVGSYWQGMFPEKKDEYYNLPRQSFPDVYKPNGYIDIIKSAHVLNENNLHGGRILSFITDHAIDIDTPDDIKALKYELLQNSHGLLELMDGVK